MEKELTFEDFLTELLRRGRVKDEHIAVFLAPENLAEAQISFTHSSFDPDHNYEEYEYYGDPVINEFVPWYIHARYPKIKSIKWLTRIKHNLISKKFLAQLARRQGLEKFIRFGENLTTKKGVQFLLKDVIEELQVKSIPEIVGHPAAFTYLSMLEDTMEAFFGWLVMTIQKSGFSHGVAIQVCHNILRSFFDVEEISIEYDQVFDAVSRLKELYESKSRGYRWPNDKAYLVEQKGDKFEATVYGWPTGDKKVTDENRVVLASKVMSFDKDDAKQRAAAKALQVLARTYHIMEAPPDPYQK
jgi:dsRNA-specific ribonuclease